MAVSFVGSEDLLHPLDPAAPVRLETIECGAGAQEVVGLGADDRLATDSVLAHQFGPLQHGDVLLHRRHADRVFAGQGRDREPALVGAAEDVTADRIGQRLEQQVGGPLVVVDWFLSQSTSRAGRRRRRAGSRRGWARR